MADQTASRAYRVQSMSVNDVFDAVAKGWEDFKAKPSHYFFVATMLPIIGVFAWILVIQQRSWPLIFPLLAGLSLIGPSAALVFYALSRQREAGQTPSWVRAFSQIPTDSIISILTLTGVLVVIFGIWIHAAQTIYDSTLGPDIEPSLLVFLGQVFTTPEGLELLVKGNLAGFALALIVLMVSAVSFPMVLDRRAGPMAAMIASIRVFFRNPVTMLVWGAVIGISLAAGTALALVGLAVVLPVLGHASWHIYRKTIA